MQTIFGTAMFETVGAQCGRWHHQLTTVRLICIVNYLNRQQNSNKVELVNSFKPKWNNLIDVNTRVSDFKC